MNRIRIIFIFLIWYNVAEAQEIKLIRACNGGNDNTLFWRAYPDPCLLTGTMDLYGRDALSGLFFKIDSNLVPGASGQYNHVNANVPAVKDWSYFLVFRKNCGSGDADFSGDTLFIDNEKPDSTILDSVSVDPITNVVYIGWSSNRTPDFSAYYLYNYDRPDPRLKENFRDTFFTDFPTTNPKSKSLTYDITSSDSCDNRKDYGKYPHKTILLSSTIDTCSSIITINWSAYVGWVTNSYEIYGSRNGGAFEWLATVSGTTNSWQENSVPISTTFSYFVRAKGTHPNSNPVSSSSNSTNVVQSGISLSPTNTRINFVTNNTSGKLEIDLGKNPGSTYSNMYLHRKIGLAAPVVVHQFGSTNTNYEDPTAVNTVINQYFSVSFNACGAPSDTTPISKNVVLNLVENDPDISLWWNSYSTWNSGVKEYIIFRSSGTTMETMGPYFEVFNAGTDTNFSELRIEENVVCYQVLAREGLGTYSSLSNNRCAFRSGNVYCPNAISRFGINNHFGFQGIGVDLKKSSFQIYNRWGQLEFSTSDATLGWFGENNSGSFVSAGVYFYTASVWVGNESVNLKGNITVLE